MRSGALPTCGNRHATGAPCSTCGQRTANRMHRRCAMPTRPRRPVIPGLGRETANGDPRIRDREEQTWPRRSNPGVRVRELMPLRWRKIAVGGSAMSDAQSLIHEEREPFATAADLKHGRGRPDARAMGNRQFGSDLDLAVIGEDRDTAEDDQTLFSLAAGVPSGPARSGSPVRRAPSGLMHAELWHPAHGPGNNRPPRRQRGSWGRKFCVCGGDVVVVVLCWIPEQLTELVMALRTSLPRRCRTNGWYLTNPPRDMNAVRYFGWLNFVTPQRSFTHPSK